MSTILSTYEMITGHCSSQARQVVQAQSTSGWMNSVTWTGLPASDLQRLRVRAVPCRRARAVGGW